MLLLDERIRADGAHARTYAGAAGDRIVIRGDDGVTGELSLVALERVMQRYGLPVADEVARTPSDAALELAGGRVLWRLRHHAIVDATGRDYLVWECPDHEPVAALATTVAAALRYLVLRIAGERSQESEG